jgi:hypothetical protein
MSSTDVARGLASRRTVVVVQSGYLPWKGYFDLIRDADLFVFYDDVQFTRQDWRSRNRIKTASGTRWLSIPAGTGLDRRICDVPLPGGNWARKHWATISQAYARAPFFRQYRELVEGLYRDPGGDTLSDFNQHAIRTIAREALGLGTEFRDSREYVLSGRRLDRLVDLLGKAGATRYVSGPSARAYIEPAAMASAGIELVWKSYEGYPEYPQLHPPFDHQVSIVDLLFNAGPRAAWFIWGWRESPP